MCRIKKFEEPNPPKNGAKPIYYYVDNNGCFISVSHRYDRDGYAKLCRFGKDWLLHRYVYLIKFGEIPDGLVVRHKCDNPKCCNPEHLELGTQLENMRDIILRDRKRKSSHRLSDQQKNDIGESDLTIRQLAVNYKLSHATIIRVKAMHRIKSNRKLAVDKPSIPNRIIAKQKLLSN